MSTTYTPVRWIHKATAGNHDFAVYDEATGKDVALVRDFNEPHARLIAAAPEMREIIDALIELGTRTDDAAYREFDEAMDEARALIARIDEVKS